jgi:hypothetical protein
VPVYAAAAASAAAPAPAPGSQPASWWQQVLHWWDVGQAESEKSRKPQKISETLCMAGSLVSNEKRLISAAVVLMVSARYVASSRVVPAKKTPLTIPEHQQTACVQLHGHTVLFAARYSQLCTRHSTVAGTTALISAISCIRCG